MRRNDGLKLTLDEGKTTIVEVKLNQFEAVRGEVATKVNLSGTLDSPQFSTREALGGFLENAFVRAILPGFEGKDGSKSG